MVIMGLVSLVFAAFMLYRRRDIKRFFAYSSIEHMGIVTFAFGLGGAIANFAGLLQMTMHSLTKSAIFFAVGHIAQAKGTQRFAQIHGLSESNPSLAFAFALTVVAIAGLPPFGIFKAEFLLATSTFARAPWLAVIFGVRAPGRFRRAHYPLARCFVRQALALRSDSGRDLIPALCASCDRAGRGDLFAATPRPLVRSGRENARVRAMAKRVDETNLWPRRKSTRQPGSQCAEALGRGEGELFALFAEVRSRAHGVARRRRRQARAFVTVKVEDGPLSFRRRASRARHSPRARDPRSFRL